jgi:hypothetical protein
MTKKQPIVKDQVNVITLQCAKDWHNAFKDQNKKLGFDKGDFPNSIVIPFVDIEQIVNDFRDIVHENVNGVRIYFVIKPTKKANGNPNISCICVPTKGPHSNDPDVTYTDMIVKAELRDGAPENPDCRGGKNEPDRRATVAFTADADDSGDDYVSIYDFVRPCPPYCNPESGDNSVG